MQGSRKIKRSTGIRIEAGAAGRHTRALAEQTAAARECTEKNRSRSFKVFLEFLGTDADRRIDTITPAICREFVRRMLKRVSRNTVRQFRTYVAAVFTRAVEVDDYLGKNPFAGVDMGVEARAIIPERGEDQQKRLPFTLEEVRFMIQSFPAPLTARTRAQPDFFARRR